MFIVYIRKNVKQNFAYGDAAARRNFPGWSRLNSNHIQTRFEVTFPRTGSSWEQERKKGLQNTENKNLYEIFCSIMFRTPTVFSFDKKIDYFLNNYDTQFRVMREKSNSNF